MKALDRLIDGVDRLQQRTRLTSIAVAVIKAHSDARAGMLAGLTTFYGFLATFPLLLLFFTLVAVLLDHHQALQKQLINGVLSQFPDLGMHLETQIHSLSKNSGLVYALTFLGLVWGGLGVARALGYASNAIWKVPRAEEGSFWHRLREQATLLAIIAVTVLVTTGTSALSTNQVAKSFASTTWFHVIELILGGMVNVLGYRLALGVLAPPATESRTLLPGALVGGIGWTVLQVIGSTLLAHHLQQAGALYGIFAVVLGLIFWINLGTQLFLYSTELNVVLATHAWPRSLREQRVEVATL